MSDEKYELQLKTLGLEMKPFPFYYTPDEYARWLMRNVPKKPPFSYSDRTSMRYTKEERVDVLLSVDKINYLLGNFLEWDQCR